ncbi:uncharacterized protein LOC132262537 [Phlebotomus argentipes]|uniref:uncharacterized protein LOC132262537 n=1 Tax=Phlebotomus argentipes TaxID=94469 RepID=UPI002893726D|nr:uncharacterized protein LOC132262537 [Phlebotomus argentipes]
MRGVKVLISLLALLTPLASAKSCPEPTRAHLTRCDKYFRCVQLPSGNIVWIPNQCDTGLIYEPSLKMCVLPGDDWECTLPGDRSAAASDDSNIYGVNNLEYLGEQLGALNDDEGSEVTISQSQPQLQDFSQEDEFSGDGDPEIITDKIAEEKVGLFPLPISTNPNSELTTHLQRLTQLIDNFHKNNTTPDTPVLHPDDLNSFLALHNIRHQSNTYNSSNKLVLPENGKIHPDTLSQILTQQNQLQKHEMVQNPQLMGRIKQKINPISGDGSTIHVKSAGLSQIPFRPDSYSNSQIVVNRPEGAVLFNVAKPRDTVNPQQKPEPYISENTLKTVLELSKQLVSTNHPVVPPVIYTIPIPYPTSAVQSERKKVERNTTKVKDEPQAISVTVKEPISSTPSPQLNYYIDSYGVKYSPQVESFPLSYTSGINYYPPYPPLTYSYSNYPVDSPSAAPFDAQGGIYHAQEQSYLTPPTFGATSHYQLYGASLASGPGGQAQPANYNFGSTAGSNQAILTNHNWFDDNKHFQQREPEVSQTDDEETDEEEMEEESEDMESKESLLEALADLQKPSETPPPGFVQVANQLLDAENGKNKIINVRGNYFTYDTYKDTILPLLSNSDGSLESGVEILSCSMGVRQPNATDCTRYFVCNPKTGGLLSYSCPPFTAFNPQSRICDARTFSSCNPLAIQNRFTISENKRLQYEAQKALEEAKRVREEAIKAQKLATLIRLQAQNAISQKVPTQMTKPMRVSSSRVTTRRPTVAASATTAKRKRYRCEVDGGAVPDTTSSAKYVVCFKGSNGHWRRHAMTCSEGLIFCVRMRKCTLQRKCRKYF